MKKYLTILLATIFLTSCNNKSENTIELFNNINGIIPGLTKMEEIRENFGNPDIIETRKREKVGDIETGGNKIVKYTNIGMTLVFDSNEIDNEAVGSIFVESPFNGKSKEGVYLGMTKNECLEILNRNYVQGDNYGDFYFYARNKNAEDNLQIWFENDLLIRIKMFK